MLMRFVISFYDNENMFIRVHCSQPTDMESEEESDDDSEYSEASEDSDSDG